MYSLIFDTTAAACSIVLSKNGDIVDSFCQTMDFGQSEVLIPAIKKILQTQRLNFADVQEIFVCIGPGSFTGVRASISAAKVFTLAQEGVVVSGFNAFDAYKECLKNDEIAPINAVVIETRRDDFYVRFYDGKLQPLSEGQALTREEIITYMRSRGTTVGVIGDGVERLLSQPSRLNFHSIKMCDCIPIVGLNAIALQQQRLKKYNFPKPLYIRPADVSLPKA